MSVFFTGQALQIAGTGTRKRLIKLKPFFTMHVVIYTVAVAVEIKPKNTQTNTHSEHRFPAPSPKLCQIWLRGADSALRKVRVLKRTVEAT